MEEKQIDKIYELIDASKYDEAEVEIKKILDEKLFKELEAKGELTESELDKYFEMFDKAKSLLVKEKITIIIKKGITIAKNGVI